MSRNTVKEEYCPVARSVDLLGDRWSLLIVRNAFDGMTRFGIFSAALGWRATSFLTGFASWLRRKS
jgi:DNA-binding HxlR family transcriptional regulator